jgi:hypothetical protein
MFAKVKSIYHYENRIRIHRSVSLWPINYAIDFAVSAVGRQQQQIKLCDLSVRRQEIREARKESKRQTFAHVERVVYW